MLADLLSLANENPDATSFERAALELLQRKVGFDAACFMVKGIETNLTASGLSPQLLARAARGGPRYYRDLLPVKQAALQARGVAVDTRVMGERRVHQTSYYRELVRSVGGSHTLMAYAPLRGQIVAAVMLGRAGKDFSDVEIGLIESALPALGVARGSYGVPLIWDALKVPARTGLLQRFGLGRSSSVLASERIGEMTVEVRDRGGFREMVAQQEGAELIWTRADLRDPGRSGWPYVELFHLAAVQAKMRRRALFVGSGGAVALRQFASLYPGLLLDLVEREPQVIALARTWYDLDTIPGLSVHIADAADFVEQTAAAAWDIVVIDAFDVSDGSDRLQQQPFISAVRRLLAPGGAVALNVIGTLGGPGPVQDVARILSSGFERLRIVPVLASNERYCADALRNVVLVASRAG
jgi:spermidine synthase